MPVIYNCDTCVPLDIDIPIIGPIILRRVHSFELRFSHVSKRCLSDFSIYIKRDALVVPSPATVLLLDIRNRIIISFLAESKSTAGSILRFDVREMEIGI